MKLQRWSLRAKLLGSFGAMTIIVFLVGVIDFFMLYRISKTYTDILEKNTSKEVAMLEMNIKVLNIDVIIKEILGVKDKDSRLSLIHKAQGLHDDYKKSKEVYEAIARDSDEEEVYTKLQNSWHNIESSSDKILEFYQAGIEVNNVEFNQLMGSYSKDILDYSTLAQKLNSIQKKAIETQIDRVNKIKNWSEAISLSLVLLGIFLPLFLGFIFSKNISHALRHISDELSTGANLLRGISSEMASSSNSLSSSTSTQASALQETMAAVSQMAAMISRNSDNTSNSQKESENSASSASRGQEAVQSMLASVHEIEESNMTIMNRIETSHKEMSEIVHVINEIAQKTKVINEIVFQTKLLSFNASVEAARAGEHGKGFAVVAEEVGNLAQMSGNAAKEITQLLDQSVQKVEHTVKRTREEVEHMMAAGGEKVRKGIEGGQRCGQVLGEIVESVNVVHNMLIEIAKASAEQSTGVNEIENAMGQLDEITQSNSASAQLSLTNADNLKSQADQIVIVIEELNGLLNGIGQNGHAVESGTATVSAPKKATTVVNNVVELKPINKESQYKFKSAHTGSAPAASPQTIPAHAAMVSGSNIAVPNRDDNRFEDV